MSEVKTVKRILAKGKKFKTVDKDGNRERHEGRKTLVVTEAQAEAFKSHWEKEVVRVAEPEGEGKDPKVAAAEAAVAKAKGELAKKPEDAALKQEVAKAEAALKALQG